jgi:hypothetical protein
MKNITEKLSLTPAEFRQLTGWSVYKIHRLTDIPIHSLYNYLKSPEDPNYREPKPFIKRYFGLIYQHYLLSEQ